MKYLNAYYAKLLVKAVACVPRMNWNTGYCHVCGRNTIFLKLDKWLRDYYRCACCLSIPRQRALKLVLDQVCPDWRSKAIHESSPNGPLSKRISQECLGYVGSQYYTDVPVGSYKGAYVSQNLERQSFADRQFDIVITQDVLEHVLHPKLAFAEISRTLKPGGVHIFTVPLDSELATQTRAVEVHGRLEHLREPIYHKNPVDVNGSLVITDWGHDIVNVIRCCSDMTTEIFNRIDPHFGIDGEYRDVLVSKKGHGEPSCS